LADFAEYIEKEVKAAPQHKKVNTTNTKSSKPICMNLSNTLDKEVDSTPLKQQQEQSSCNSHLLQF
jgi:hypothetical protein